MRWLTSDWDYRDNQNDLVDPDAGFIEINQRLRGDLESFDMRLSTEQMGDFHEISSISVRRDPECITGEYQYKVIAPDGSQIRLTDEEADKLIGIQSNPEDMYNACEKVCLESEYSAPLEKWDLTYSAIDYISEARKLLKNNAFQAMSSDQKRESLKKLGDKLIYSATWYPSPADKRIHDPRARQILELIKEKRISKGRLYRLIDDASENTTARFVQYFEKLIRQEEKIEEINSRYLKFIARLRGTEEEKVQAIKDYTGVNLAVIRGEEKEPESVLQYINRFRFAVPSHIPALQTCLKYVTELQLRDADEIISKLRNWIKFSAPADKNYLTEVVTNLSRKILNVRPLQPINSQDVSKLWNAWRMKEQEAGEEVRIPDWLLKKNLMAHRPLPPEENPLTTLDSWIKELKSRALPVNKELEEEFAPVDWLMALTYSPEEEEETEECCFLEEI